MLSPYQNFGKKVYKKLARGIQTGLFVNPQKKAQLWVCGQIRLVVFLCCHVSSLRDVGNQPFFLAGQPRARVHISGL
jgi:hypothetical protein